MAHKHFHNKDHHTFCRYYYYYGYIAMQNLRRPNKVVKIGLKPCSSLLIINNYNNTNIRLMGEIFFLKLLARNNYLITSTTANRIDDGAR